MALTVQELIDRLMEIEDKSLEVIAMDTNDEFNVIGVDSSDEYATIVLE